MKRWIGRMIRVRAQPRRLPIVVVRFTAERLDRFIRAALEAAGLRPDEAGICADAALFADLRGTDTHGVMYVLPRTLESIREGRTVPGARCTIEQETGAGALTGSTVGGEP